MIKKSKKILSLLLSLIMIISMSAGLEISSVAEDDILNYLTYEINDGEVTITGCDTSISGDVVIPDTIEGYPVTRIDGYSFKYCINIKSIVFPENLKTIAYDAFSYCSGLVSLTIPYSVETIGNFAFRCCDSLENITVAENNNFFSADEYGVLYDKNKTELIQYPIGNSRTEYIIPDTVTIINHSAFKGCSSLRKIVIPDSIKTIAYSAFENCNNIESLAIPNGIEVISTSAFASCKNLTRVTTPTGVYHIGNYAFGYNYNDDTSEYELCEDFIIIGVYGSSAETYANENGITFISVGGEEPTTKEPVTDAPTTEKPSERPTEKPSTDGPAIDGPATDGPTEKPTEKPVSDKLEVSDKNVKVDEKGKTVTLGQNNTVESVSKVIKNSKTAIFGKDGKELGKSDLVGTGAKIRLMDNSGKVVSEYTVCVPNDVDGNGKTTAADARLALRGSAKLEKIEGVYALASDVDGNGKVTAADARKILRISAGLEKA